MFSLFSFLAFSIQCFVSLPQCVAQFIVSLPIGQPNIKRLKNRLIDSFLEREFAKSVRKGTELNARFNPINLFRFHAQVLTKANSDSKEFPRSLSIFIKDLAANRRTFEI